MAESDNLLTKMQDLLVYLIPQRNKFPRDQKFVLGESPPDAACFPEYLPGNEYAGVIGTGSWLAGERPDDVPCQ